MNQMPALAPVFAYLSLLTVGGGMAAFPEMKILTVDVHKWLTFPQLIHLYSVGQMAPGPNMMMIVAIGEWAGGFLGAVVTRSVSLARPLCLLLLSHACGRDSRIGHGEPQFRRASRQSQSGCCSPAASPWQKWRSLGLKRNDRSRSYLTLPV